MMVSPSLIPVTRNSNIPLPGQLGVPPLEKQLMPLTRAFPSLLWAFRLIGAPLSLLTSQPTRKLALPLISSNPVHEMFVKWCVGVGVGVGDGVGVGLGL